jgi:hypothetical protein
MNYSSFQAYPVGSVICLEKNLMSPGEFLPLSVRRNSRNRVKALKNNILNSGFVEGNGFYGRSEGSFEKTPLRIILY